MLPPAVPDGAKPVATIRNIMVVTETRIGFVNIVAYLYHGAGK